MLNSYSHDSDSKAKQIPKDIHVIKQESFQGIVPDCLIPSDQPTITKFFEKHVKLSSGDELGLYCKELIKLVNSDSWSIKQIIKRLDKDRSRWEPLREILTNQEKFDINIDLGYLYYTAFRYNEALEFFKEAEKAGRIASIENEVGLREIYNMKGDIFTQQGNFEKAIKNLTQAADIQKKYFPTDEYMITSNNTNLAQYYYNTKKYTEARSLLDKVLNYWTKSKYDIMKINCHIWLAELAIKQGEIKEAKTVLLTALDLLKKIEIEDLIEGRYSCLMGDIYFLEGNKVQAKLEYEKGIRKLDKLLPKENSLSSSFLEKYKNQFGVYFNYDDDMEDFETNVQELLERIEEKKDSEANDIFPERENEDMQPDFSLSSISLISDAFNNRKNKLLRILLEAVKGPREIIELIEAEIKNRESYNPKDQKYKETFMNQQLWIYTETAKVCNDFKMQYKSIKMLRKARKCLLKGRQLLRNVRKNPKTVLEKLKKEIESSVKDMLNLMGNFSKNLRQSENYFQVSLDINEMFSSRKISDEKYQTLFFRGKVYMNYEEKWKNAEQDFLEVLKLSSKDKKLSASTYFSLIELSLKRRDMKYTQEYLNKAETLIINLVENTGHFQAILNHFVGEVRPQYPKGSESAQYCDKTIKILERTCPLNLNKSDNYDVNKTSNQPGTDDP